MELAFEHKEHVNLASVTIEHVLPQTLTEDWIAELGPDAKDTHALLFNTLGNLTLTAYNSELGNLKFADKKERLANTHIELNRWILDQKHWREKEIADRAELLLNKAKELWVGPGSVAA